MRPFAFAVAVMCISPLSAFAADDQMKPPSPGGLLKSLAPPRRCGTALLGEFLKRMGWVGQQVFPRTFGVPVYDGKDGNAVDWWGVTHGVVLKEDGVWVEVRHSQPPGPFQAWVKKQEVVKAADAAAFFTNELEKEENDPWLYQIRAQAWCLTGEYASALEDITAALRLSLKPQQVGLYVNRGNVYYLKGDHGKAIDDYSEALRLDSECSIALNNRGLTYADQGEDAKAIKDFTEAIRLEPEYLQAYLNRGIAYSKAGEYDKAIPDYTAAIKLDPKDAVSFYCRGRTYTDKGEYEKAIKDYREAIRLWPHSAEALARYAWLLATCSEAKYRDGEKAVELAKKAIELAGKEADWRYSVTLAGAYAEIGDFQKAIEYEKKALEDPDYAEQPRARFKLELYKRGERYRFKAQK
jgi:tetratricopeptide (TPR) repeat protein